MPSSDDPNQGPSGGAADLDAEHQSLSVHLARAGLLQIIGRVLARLAHDVSGHAFTLMAVQGLLIDEASPELSGHLEAEIRKLERLAGHLRRLPTHAGGDPVPVMPGEAAAEALALADLERGFEEVERVLEADDDLPPLFAGPQRVLGVLLVLLSAAQRTWVHGTSREPIVLRLVPGNGSVAFEVRGAEIPPMDADRLQALAAVLARDGGTVRQDADGSLVATFPTVAAEGLRS